MSDEWLGRLKRACERDGQSAVARALGVSPATVSLVLRGKYPADMKAIQQRVVERLRDERVVCPELGEIGDAACMAEQGRPFSTANPARVRMWRACRGCQHLREERG